MKNPCSAKPFNSHTHSHTFPVQTKHIQAKRYKHAVSASIDPFTRSRVTPLENSRQLANLRLFESTSASPLLIDPYAAQLVDDLDPLHLPSNPEQLSNIALDLLATKFVDDQVMLASSKVNAGRNGMEYNQVVIIGDGYCTRPFRLPWTSGTVIYLVAPAEVHERAEATLGVTVNGNALRARVPRGCLLRRVDCSLTGQSSCAIELEKAGYRPDRLSVWALQGIRRMNLSKESIDSIFADISNLAALESLILGELPAMSAHDVDNLLASFGLLGTTFSLEEFALKSIENKNQWWWDSIKNSHDLRLFRAQQRRLSLAEIDLYESHVAAAEEVDEDFFGNFS